MAHPQSGDDNAPAELSKHAAATFEQTGDVTIGSAVVGDQVNVHLHPPASEAKSGWVPGWALVAIVALALAALVGIYLVQASPGSSTTMLLQVRVRAAGTEAAVPNAEVTLDTEGPLPQDEFTDGSGLAAFRVAAGLTGSTARITVEAPGYSRYVQLITLRDNPPLEEIRLQPAP